MALVRSLHMLVPEEFAQLCERLKRRPEDVLEQFMADAGYVTSGRRFIAQGSNEREAAAEWLRLSYPMTEANSKPFHPADRYTREEIEAAPGIAEGIRRAIAKGYDETQRTALADVRYDWHISEPHPWEQTAEQLARR